jgi:hypothetical protein
MTALAQNAARTIGDGLEGAQGGAGCNPVATTYRISFILLKL